jgi:pimeloyl-ACP methyl ester carboxylesterase
MAIMPRMTDQPVATDPISRSLISQGLTLSYVDWGNDSAPPLLLVHGARDHARSWDWTARALRDRWHVVALDLRGHGDSAWSPDGAYLFPYHLLDLAEMVDTFGPAPVTIVGHSFGGNVAARYAGLYPDRVRKIVFLDSLGPAPDNYALWDKAGPVARTREWMEQRRDPRPMAPRRFATIEDASARMARNNPRLTPEQVLHLTRHGLRHHEDGYGWKFDPRVGMFAPEDFAVQGAPYWQAVTAPALILYGRESWHPDPVADGRTAFFRDKRTIGVEGAGHWIHHDRLDVFLTALDGFL